jgi:hypothetical protein
MEYNVTIFLYIHLDMAMETCPPDTLSGNKVSLPTGRQALRLNSITLPSQGGNQKDVLLGFFLLILLPYLILL